MKTYTLNGVQIYGTLIDGWELDSEGIAHIYGTDGQTYEMSGQRFGGDDGVVCMTEDGGLFWLPPQVFEDLATEVPAE